MGFPRPGMSRNWRQGIDQFWQVIVLCLLIWGPIIYGLLQWIDTLPPVPGE